ncbi:MAG TPA: O-antigen ligase family protein [Gemmatimonadaceae bacterium]|nr:O-antigen ligase family protein [Gemmatimonadaceae bacterium]
MVLGISRLHQHFAFIGMLRPGLLLAGIGLAAAWFHPANLSDGSWKRRWTTKVVIGLSIVALGSIAFGISQGGAFHSFVENYSKVLIGTFLLMAAIRGARDLWLFSWAYVIGAGCLVWLALFVFQLSTDSAGVARLNDMYTWDSNDVGLVLLVGLPLTMLTLRTSGFKGKLVSGAVLLGIGATIARTGSRGAFVGTAVVLLAYLFSLKGASVVKRVGTIVALAVGLALAAPQGYWKQMNTLTSVEDDYNWDAAQGRRQLAIRGVGYMLDRPLFGIGIDNFGRAEATISDRAVAWTPDMPGIKWSAAHNSYLQAGAELGVPGLLLFCTLVFGCIIAPWRLRRRIPAAWAHGDWEEQFLFQMAAYLPLSALGFAVAGFFVSFAYHDPIYILAAMTGALTAAVESRLRGSRPDVAVPQRGPVSPARGGRGGLGPPRARSGERVRGFAYVRSDDADPTRSSPA